jgi:hypothetical protein
MRDRVQVLTHNGVEVVSATCEWSIRTDRVGRTMWSGILVQIHPKLVLQAREYRLRLSTGDEGDILVSRAHTALRGLRSIGEGAVFVGTGPPPGERDWN